MDKYEKTIELLKEIQQDYVDCKDYHEALDEAIEAIAMENKGCCWCVHVRNVAIKQAAYTLVISANENYTAPKVQIYGADKNEIGGFTIKYCPNCGRNLRKDDNNGQR